MEETTEEYSLLDELNLRNRYEIVARKNGQLVYAHTVYYQLLESDCDDFINEYSAEREKAEKEHAKKEKRKLSADEEKRRADEVEEQLRQLKEQLEALKLNQD